MRWIPVLFFCIIVPFAGCSTSASCIAIVPPAVNLTGEKTSVERQIVGDYREIEKDAWAVSSVKTSAERNQSSGGYAAADAELLAAMKVREFHRDKIRSYKDEGALGENNEGLIAYRATAKYEKNRAEKDILMSVITNENSARNTIFVRSLMAEGKEKPADGEIRTFARNFAAEQASDAQKNDWIQDVSGKWKRK